MDIADFIVRLKKMREGLAKHRVNSLQQAGLDAVAMIDQRIRSQGKNAEGQSFGVYAPSTRKVKQATGRTRSPYPNVNFVQQSGNSGMMNSLQMIRTIENEDQVTIFITSVGVDKYGVSNQTKLEANTKRFGQIIDLSDDEIKALRQSILTRYINYINNNL